jgi:hypothetical protein
LAKRDLAWYPRNYKCTNVRTRDGWSDGLDLSGKLDPHVVMLLGTGQACQGCEVFAGAVELKVQNLARFVKCSCDVVLIDMIL